MATKKLEEKELSRLKENNTKGNQIIDALGQLDIEKAIREAKREELLSQFATIQEENNKLAKELSEKYGTGSIDLNSGEITIPE